MSVWLTIPSAKAGLASQECIDAWAAQGYRTAVFRDAGSEHVNCDMLVMGEYGGYAKAVNDLISRVMCEDKSAQWFIPAGDDIFPDPKRNASEIEAELADHFGGTFGVMQPTGDRWGENLALPEGHPHRGAYIDRVCGSAFIGREFVERTYGGKGPLYPGYFHMFVDEELQAVAEGLGVLWQRRELAHSHRHWQREARGMPSYLVRANSIEHWGEAQALFKSRKAAGFPGAVAA